MPVNKPCDKVSSPGIVSVCDKPCDRVSPPSIVPACDNKGGGNAPMSVALSGLSLVEEMAVTKAFTVEPIQPCMQLDGNHAEAIEGGDGNKAKQKKETKKLSEYNEFVAANMKDRTLFPGLPHRQRFSAVVAMWKETAGAMKVVNAVKATKSGEQRPWVGPYGCSKCRNLPTGCANCEPIKKETAHKLKLAKMKLAPPRSFRKYVDDVSDGDEQGLDSGDEQGMDSSSSDEQGIDSPTSDEQGCDSETSEDID